MLWVLIRSASQWKIKKKYQHLTIRLKKASYQELCWLVLVWYVNFIKDSDMLHFFTRTFNSFIILTGAAGEIPPSMKFLF